MSDEPWYFAFGANMSTRLFVERRGMRPSHFEPAELRDWRLAFLEPGVLPLVEPAFASIEPAPGSSVHGVLYRLPEEDLVRLDRSESANYRRETIRVDGIESGRVEALAYRSMRTIENARPSRRYLEILLDGAEEHELPMHYRRWLESHESAYLPVVSEVFNTLAPTYLWLRDKGVRPEVLWFKLRDRLQK